MVQEYIQVPVPAHLVPEVMQLIAGSLSGKPVLVAQDAGWTAAELTRIWDESAQNVRRTLKLLASNSGSPVTGQTIAREVMGKDDKGHSIAGMMGAFGRRMKGRHQSRNPIQAKWNAVEVQWEYTLDPEAARVFGEIIEA